MSSSMHKPKETVITNSILKFLKGLPEGFAWKQHGGIYGTSGLPDVMYIRPCDDGPPGSSEVFGFEVKRPGRFAIEEQTLRREKDATAIQAAMMDELEMCGVRCYVVYSKDEVMGILEGFYAGLR